MNFSELKRSLTTHGFNIYHSVSIPIYNASINNNSLRRLEGKAGLLIGSTGSIWNPFLNSPYNNKQLDHPLDEYVGKHIKDITSRYSSFIKEVVFTTTLDVDFQLLSHKSGLAYFNKASHLCIHPHFGAWFSLRALIIFNEDVETPCEFVSELTNPVSDEVEEKVRKLMEVWKEGGKDSWKQLVAARNCFGGVCDFGEDQIRYHYTKNKDFLK